MMCNSLAGNTSENKSKGKNLLVHCHYGPCPWTNLLSSITVRTLHWQNDLLPQIGSSKLPRQILHSMPWAWGITQLVSSSFTPHCCTSSFSTVRWLLSIATLGFGTSTSGCFNIREKSPQVFHICFRPQGQFHHSLLLLLSFEYQIQSGGQSPHWGRL